MTEDYGPLYSKDDDFKAKARLHQAKFRVNNLKADYHEYGNRLAKNDALAGNNFIN